MNREQGLFLVVLVIALLWAGSALMGPVEPLKGRVRMTNYVNPDIPESPGKSLTMVELWAYFTNSSGGRTGLLTTKGRSIMMEHSDLLPVERAVLDLPRSLATPVVLTPVSPFPSVPFFRNFRSAETRHLSHDQEPPDEDPIDEDEDEDDLDDPSKILGSKWEFVDADWDLLQVGFGGKWYGTISLTKEASGKGLTKFSLLLEENRSLPFFFEKINSTDGRIESSGNMTMDGSDVKTVRFADNVANAYWSRRTLDRVKADDADALLTLGNWAMPLADTEGYDRLKGLELAVATFTEALAARPGNNAITLALGEALHRAFRFDDEMKLYDDALAEKANSAIYARRARLYNALELFDVAAADLTEALNLAPGDHTARLMRGEARYAMAMDADPTERDRLLSGAFEDFEEVRKTGASDRQTAAAEGRARVLLARGDPRGASSALASATDVESLVTRGAAKYALMDWAGAVEDFRSALDVEADHPRALSNLGIALAQQATQELQIVEALAHLDKAREVDPLNYYWPPLGRGIAEERRGKPVDSVDAYNAAARALPTEPFAHYILGVSYLRDGLFDEARKEFRRALVLDWRFSDALLGVGTASMALGDWKSAREHLIRASEVEPENALILYRLGRAWLVSDDKPDTSRYAAGRQVFDRILEKDPQNVPAFNALGYLYYQLGESTEAIRKFNQALALAEAGTGPDRSYAEEMKRRIIDSQSRRLWVDDFERPNSSKVGGKWRATQQGGLRWRLNENKAQIKGMAQEDGKVWLVHADVLSGKNGLNGRLINAETVVSAVASDRVAFRFMLYSPPPSSGSEIRNGIGIEKTSRGEVAFVFRKQSDKQWTVKIAKDAEGNNMAWPAGDVTLRIERTDAKKGNFAAFLGEQALGTVDGLLKQRANSALEFGFTTQATNGEEYGVTVDSVTLEIYSK